MNKWKLLLAGMIVVLSSCTLTEPEKKASMVTIEKKHEEKVSLPQIEHIVVVVEENHSKTQIINNPSAPYMNSLINQGANLTNYHAITHPSEPNYFDLFAGTDFENQTISNDGYIGKKFSTDNLGSELIKKGYSFAGYSESQPSVGYDGKNYDNYADRHNPWKSFTNVPALSNQPFKNFPSDFSKLPTVSIVVPNIQNDMHDGTITQADTWLEQNLDAYIKWAKAHNSLLVVTWDEDEGSDKNIIPTFFVGPMVKAGQYNEDVNHFSLLRTIEDIYGLSHAGHAETSESIKSIWR